MTRGQRGVKRVPAPTQTELPPPTIPITPSPPRPVLTKPLYLCSPFVEAALVKGNFKTIVMLPKYVDIMEWVAVNSMSSSSYFKFSNSINLIVFDFYTNLNEFYGVITECCTQQACPSMSAGQTYVSLLKSVMLNR